MVALMRSTSKESIPSAVPQVAGPDHFFFLLPAATYVCTTLMFVSDVDTNTNAEIPGICASW